MEWLNLHTSTLDSPAFLGAEPLDRATWLCLLRYCIGQENSGIIDNCGEWGDRKWQQLCRVKLREVKRRCDLFEWLDGSLIVKMYPAEKEKEVKRNRAVSKEGAAIKWGNDGSASATRGQRLAAARAKGTHTHSEWTEMVGYYGACLRCGDRNAELVKDHIIPIYQGGSDSIRNLQPLCRSCNSSKGPDSTDLRKSSSAGLPAKWAAETPGAPGIQMPAEGEGKGREGKEGEGKSAPPPRHRFKVFLKRMRLADDDGAIDEWLALAKELGVSGFDRVADMIEYAVDLHRQNGNEARYVRHVEQGCRNWAKMKRETERISKESA